jgi:hypothetical protein
LRRRRRRRGGDTERALLKPRSIHPSSLLCHSSSKRRHRPVHRRCELLGQLTALAAYSKTRRPRVQGQAAERRPQSRRIRHSRHSRR